MVYPAAVSRLSLARVTPTVLRSYYALLWPALLSMRALKRQTWTATRGRTEAGQRQDRVRTRTAPPAASSAEPQGPRGTCAPPRLSARGARRRRRR